MIKNITLIIKNENILFYYIKYINCIYKDDRFQKCFKFAS